MVKALIGTGVFAIPHVYNRAGYIVSPVSTLIVGVLVTYCVHILVKWNSSQYFELFHVKYNFFSVSMGTLGEI